MEPLSEIEIKYAKQQIRSDHPMADRTIDHVFPEFDSFWRWWYAHEHNESFEVTTTHT